MNPPRALVHFDPSLQFSSKNSVKRGNVVFRILVAVRLYLLAVRLYLLAERLYVLAERLYVSAERENMPNSRKICLPGG